MMNCVIFGVLLLVVGGGLRPSPAAADVFCDNLKQVAATLPQNTSSSPVQFATAIVGQAPDVVYALAFCQGDYNATACRECVAQALNITPPPGQQCYGGSTPTNRARSSTPATTSSTPPTPRSKLTTLLS